LGHDVALYDPTLDEDTSGFAAALAQAQPEVLVVYDDVFNWFTKMCLSRMRDAALEMIRQARAAGARVVVSGHDAADAPQVDLYAAVGSQVKAGKALAQMTAALPDRDRDWAPRDLTTDFGIAYAEITQHQPAGALPHVWK
jgi:anaerobic magnesium-protoporphyrin IX monomethyl ester cyclase